MEIRENQVYSAVNNQYKGYIKLLTIFRNRKQKSARHDPRMIHLLGNSSKEFQGMITKSLAKWLRNANVVKSNGTFLSE